MSLWADDPQQPATLVPALQQVCQMWDENPRLQALLRRKLVPIQRQVNDHTVSQNKPFYLRVGSRRLEVGFEIHMGGQLPDDFLRQLRANLILTIAELTNHPRKKAYVVFFQNWRT